jgi:Skp family chaperone for outer membrane proteins
MGLKTFREVWALAVTEGCQQQEGVIAQLREELKAVATENERLDGLGVEFAHAKETAEAERDRLVAEQRTLQAGLVKGAEQTKQVLEDLAEERAARARELAAIRQELAQEVQKVHKMELELVRFKPSDGNQTVTRRRRQ